MLVESALRLSGPDPGGTLAVDCLGDLIAGLTFGATGDRSFCGLRALPGVAIPNPTASIDDVDGLLLVLSVLARLVGVEEEAAAPVTAEEFSDATALPTRAALAIISCWLDEALEGRADVGGEGGAVESLRVCPGETGVGLASGSPETTTRCVVGGIEKRFDLVGGAEGDTGRLCGGSARGDRPGDVVDF